MKIKCVLLSLSFLFMPMFCGAQISFGNPNGNVILIEYFDYNCPVCRHFAPRIDRLARENPTLNVIQRVVPVLAPSSQLVDRLVLASFMQHQFPQVQRAVLNAPFVETIPLNYLGKIVRQCHIDPKQLLTDMNSSLVSQQISQNLTDYLSLHKHSIPVLVFFNSKYPNRKIILVGEQPMARMNHMIYFLLTKRRNTHG